MLKCKYLLYGLGLANSSVKNYFDKFNVSYDIFIDGDSKLEEFDLTNYDYIIKSPGINNNKDLLIKVKELNIKIISDLELYYLLYQDKYKIITITGSNGKTTTTSLIGRVLDNYKVCGNIGIPIFDVTDYINEGLIIEASSYMLEYTSKFKPNIYVLLNILPHHLDHHLSYENYIDAKTSVLSRLNESDYLIYNLDDEVICEKVKNINCHKLSFSKKRSDATIYLDHNFIVYDKSKYLDINKLLLSDIQFIDDFLASILVLKTLKIKDELIIMRLLSFQGLSHRFEVVYNSDFVTIINDSKSTNPYSLNEAINNLKNKFDEYYKILIVGGAKINEDYHILNDIISKTDLVYLTGENRYDLDSILIHDNKIINNDLELLLHDILNKINKKTVVLFSPGAPSFDLYKNFEERGIKFKLLINKIFLNI